MGMKVVLVFLSAVCCVILPVVRSSVDDVISGVHLEDTWQTLTEADLRAELHLPRESELLLLLPAALSLIILVNFHKGSLGLPVLSSMEKYLHRCGFYTHHFVAGTARTIFTGEVS